MLTVVGMGPAGRHLMTPAALEAIDHADALAGGKRHLAQFPAFGGERFTLGADIGALLSWIAARWDKGIVVLASGDPLFLWHRYTPGGAFWYRTGSHYPWHQRRTVSVRAGWN
ncbi:cobalt-precorrin-6Y C(5)-methyltransferase [Salmonella enterica subsp. enterica]|nr:cobalt-precorrin-6Y C(5)-methyltransferase [Salmonella enterica subsp. enterica]